MSKYADWLRTYYQEHPDFIQLATRMNEMIKNFIEPGLEDWQFPGQPLLGECRLNQIPNTWFMCGLTR